MDDRRSRHDDRRQNNDILKFPFKDSNGTTVRKCRRRIPDRRLSNIEAVWLYDLVIGKSYKR